MGGRAGVFAHVPVHACASVCCGVAGTLPWGRYATVGTCSSCTGKCGPCAARALARVYLIRCHSVSPSLCSGNLSTSSHNWKGGAGRWQKTVPAQGLPEAGIEGCCVALPSSLTTTGERVRVGPSCARVPACVRSPPCGPTPALSHITCTVQQSCCVAA